MVMIPSAGFPDGTIMDEFMAETAQAFEEQVKVRRFTSVAGGNAADGVNPTPTYQDINTLALIESLSAAELAASNGFYQLGDIKAQIRLQVYGAEAGPGGSTGGDLQAAGRLSDLIVYRGRTYKILGTPERIHYGGQYYWNTVLRKVVT